MLGPALGGALYGFGGWALPLGTAAALCVGFSLALALLLPKEPPGGARAHAHAALRDSAGPPSGLCCGPSSGLCVVTSPRLLAVLIIVASGACVFASIDSVLPVHLQQAYGSGSVGSALVFVVISVRPPRDTAAAAPTPGDSGARECACVSAALAGGRADGRPEQLRWKAMREGEAECARSPAEPRSSAHSLRAPPRSRPPSPPDA